MALRKTLARSFSTTAKLWSPEAPPPTPRSAAVLVPRLFPCFSAPDSALLRRRFLQRRPFFQSAAPRIALPVGDKLVERIREMNATRIRLEGLLPPPTPTVQKGAMVSAEEARKIVMAARAEAARERLRGTGHSCVSYAEFARVCREVAGGMEEGVRLGSALDESGAVIVFGDAVIVRPEMVAKAIESMIPASMSPQRDPRRQEELKEMEAAKGEIEATAAALVRRELWCGLALVALQTAGFMRLTFWELSWDVMEPICFFVTTLYFMAGYAFFLRTSRDPSFEGLFESRLEAKRKRLMKARKFDIARFNELRGAAGFSLSWTSEDSSASSSSPSSSFSNHCHGRRNSLVGSAN